MLKKFLDRNKCKDKDRDKQLLKLTRELIDLNLEYNIKLNKIYHKMKMLQEIELTEEVKIVPTNIPNTYKILSNPPPEVIVQSNPPPEVPIQNIVYVLNKYRNKPPSDLYTPLKTSEDDIKSIDISNNINITPITIHSLSTLSDNLSDELLDNKKHNNDNKNLLEYHIIEMTQSLPANINISKFIPLNKFSEEEITHI